MFFGHDFQIEICGVFESRRCGKDASVLRTRAQGRALALYDAVERRLNTLLFIDSVN